MKNSWIITLLIPLFSIFACMEDTSAYLPQEKEDVKVDSVENEKGDNQDEDEVLPEGELVPGIHLVRINVEQPDGEIVERRFKYYMPISIDMSRPISLIFEFHGSYDFDAGVTPDDPIGSISTSNALVQHAIQENCVICFPAGTVETQSDGSGAVNWQYSEKHIPFVDAMIDYFLARTPTIDPNRIYATGQSSGAIFSFVLAFQRSEVFAAITPRAGQMSLEDQTEMPSRAVPVRVFAGETDDIVQHSAVISNMTSWAEKIGGYFASDMVYVEDSIEIEGYTTVDTRIWSGGKADYQIYSLQDVGHSISLSYVLSYMWEFMEAHTLDNEVENLFITCSLSEIIAQCGEPFEFEVNYTDGATFNISTPKGWTLTLEGKSISLRAPADFYGDIERSGVITMTITKNGETYTREIPFTLVAPKDYFEVGDIYYNDNYEPVGVVCWVNNANIREAKIVNISEQGNLWFAGSGNGLGIDFTTPDRDNGEENTRRMAERNATLDTPLTASNALIIWAAEYSYGGIDGWYLPAINELQEMAPYVDQLNEVITELGGVLLQPLYSGDFTLYSSTTDLKEGNASKSLYSYNFTTGEEVERVPSSAGSEYIGYTQGRVFKRVTK